MKAKEKPSRRVGPEDEERGKSGHALHRPPASATARDDAARGEDLKQGVDARTEAAQAKDD